MNITSIGTSYTPLRSFQSFGMKINPSAEKIINDAKDFCNSIPRGKRSLNKRLLNQALSIIKKHNPKNTLDINYNKNSRKAEMLENGKIFFTNYCDDALQVVKHGAMFLDSKFRDKCFNLNSL